MVTTAPSTNGNGKHHVSTPPQDSVKQKMRKSPTAAYAPGAHWWGFGAQVLDGKPLFTWFDIDRMFTDPKVIFISQLWRAPFQKVQFKVKATNAKVAQFVQNTIKRFWRESLPPILSRFFEYGFAAGGAEFFPDNGWWRLSEVKALECRDVNPQVYKSGEHKNKFAGFNLQNAQGDSDYATQLVSAPHAFWFAGHGRYNRFYDRPPLAGLFCPWLEKNGRGGAIHNCRIWFQKNAASGAEVRYPPGTSNCGTDENPQIRVNQDIAREIADYLETNSTAVLENTVNPANNEYEWQIKRPEGRGDIAGFLDYRDKLDGQMVEGAGIPLEVIQGSDSGSGYKGRLVSYGGFLGTVDELTGLILKSCRAWLDPLVEVNYGPKARYEIEPISLSQIASEEEKRQPTNPVGQPLASLPGDKPGSPGSPGSEGDAAQSPFQLSTTVAPAIQLAPVQSGNAEVLEAIKGMAAAVLALATTSVVKSATAPTPATHDLREYECPQCGGCAYNGDPEKGTKYRGSARCEVCNHTFAVVGKKPILKHETEETNDQGNALSVTLGPDDDNAMTKKTALDTTQKRLMRSRKSTIAQLLALAMVRKQQEATAAGDPNAAAGSLQQLSNLAGDPMQVARIIGMKIPGQDEKEMSALELAWTEFQTRRGTKGAVNETGKKLYGQQALDALAREQTGYTPKQLSKQAAKAQAHEVLSKLTRGEAHKEDLDKLGQALPNMKVGDLKGLREVLKFNLRGERKRDHMVGRILAAADEAAKKTNPTATVPGATPADVPNREKGGKVPVKGGNTAPVAAPAPPAPAPKAESPPPLPVEPEPAKVEAKPAEAPAPTPTSTPVAATEEKGTRASALHSLAAHASDPDKLRAEAEKHADAARGVKNGVTPLALNDAINAADRGEYGAEARVAVDKTMRADDYYTVPLGERYARVAKAIAGTHQPTSVEEPKAENAPTPTAAAPASQDSAATVEQAVEAKVQEPVPVKVAPTPAASAKTDRVAAMKSRLAAKAPDVAAPKVAPKEATPTQVTTTAQSMGEKIKAVLADPKASGESRAKAISEARSWGEQLAPKERESFAKTMRAAMLGATADPTDVEDVDPNDEVVSEEDATKTENALKNLLGVDAEPEPGEVPAKAETASRELNDKVLAARAVEDAAKKAHTKSGTKAAKAAWDNAKAATAKLESEQKIAKNAPAKAKSKLLFTPEERAAEVAKVKAKTTPKEPAPVAAAPKEAPATKEKSARPPGAHPDTSAQKAAAPVDPSTRAKVAKQAHDALMAKIKPLYDEYNGLPTGSAKTKLGKQLDKLETDPKQLATIEELKAAHESLADHNGHDYGVHAVDAPGAAPRLVSRHATLGEANAAHERTKGTVMRGGSAIDHGKDMDDEYGDQGGSWHTKGSDGKEVYVSKVAREKPEPAKPAPTPASPAPEAPKPAPAATQQDLSAPRPKEQRATPSTPAPTANPRATLAETLKELESHIESGGDHKEFNRSINANPEWDKPNTEGLSVATAERVGTPEQDERAHAAAAAHTDAIIQDLKAKHTPEELKAIAKRFSGRTGKKKDGSDALELIRLELSRRRRLSATQRI